ncbi:MAG: methyltransferase domain-containing protein [Winogradskyella sp.]|uniref:methyltransferase domain-containing protein n=1 Tax=Winogradskyella sp. TaxID=1883156 RepID=UPI0018173F56|nr:methyltransferase domain-containing protein [Winogradskyella sp.]MBT8244475.1 methyltransferase domain-containing protein [Winogradskyella sp.]NNK22931.1 methyltransferase domain-containing protein [Winogradskyella sp.]
MKRSSLNSNYWENRYQNKNTGWDIGKISTPLKTYIDQLNNKDIRILVPGTGNSYEAEYLWELGFKNTYVLDIAISPLQNLKTRIPDFPTEHCLHKDFFNLNISFDLILEQTFFCALNPELRRDYVHKMADILNPKGKLVGLLFNFELTENGPPFGGDKSSYVRLFKECFNINIIEKAYNSIKARRNKELFFIFEKK